MVMTKKKIVTEVQVQNTLMSWHTIYHHHWIYIYFTWNIIIIEFVYISCEILRLLKQAAEYVYISHEILRLLKQATVYQPNNRIYIVITYKSTLFCDFGK